MARKLIEGLPFVHSVTLGSDFNTREVLKSGLQDLQNVI